MDLLNQSLNINKQVIKSPNDKNEYYLDILPNGLRYILASNPEIDRSGVGLDVYIGAADDPREYQGLAHCLEHTIFLGSEKYPEASMKELSEIISIETGKTITKSGLNHRLRKIKELAKRFENMQKEVK